ncbi:uncharacterized protein LOC117125278, partial [Anneissia japonica]|uniref:uncharacterized protein LOC117125278 n=1 Tax=Anneissia japonica TaxID=1529436 RepID=UPI001425A801
FFINHSSLIRHCNRRLNFLLFQCSACSEVAYCSKECQKTVWKSHKPRCMQIRKTVQVFAERYRSQFSQDIKRTENVSYYFGNTIAIDVLKLGLNEAEPSSDDVALQLSRDYNILFAGVGDLRNLLLTTASLPSNFTGNIRFTLNDIDPFVLARDALFLYIIITQASKESIELTITNIWYSLQLPDKDFQFLISTLNELIMHTVETLNDATCGHLVVNKEDFDIMKEVWVKWRDLECETGNWNAIDLAGQRTNLFRSTSVSSQAMSLYCQMIPERYMESATQYFVDGLFLRSNLEKGKLRFDNPTLTGRTSSMKEPISVDQLLKIKPMAYNFEYCIPSAHLPFRGWDYNQASKMFEEDSLVDLFHVYIASVIKSALSYFQKSKIFSNCCLKNCIDICNEPDVEPKYDRIMTSNVADFTGIKQLLSSMRPLLSTTNKHAVLVTETMIWHAFVQEAYILHPLNRLKIQPLSEVMVKDTGRRELQNIDHTKFDYFDNTSSFIRYLQLVYLATINKERKNDYIPTLSTIVRNMEGFTLNDFTSGLNKLVPFRYRVNARACNMENGYRRNLEWRLCAEYGSGSS